MGAGDSPEYKSSKEKAEKLQQKLKELKEEKEGINAQISNKENKNEEGKKEEDKEEDEILEALQEGYTFKNKVIRPSMVKVNKK